MSSTVRDNAITSRFENLGTTNLSKFIYYFLRIACIYQFFFRTLHKSHAYIYCLYPIDLQKKQLIYTTFYPKKKYKQINSSNKLKK